MKLDSRHFGKHKLKRVSILSEKKRKSHKQSHVYRALKSVRGFRAVIVLEIFAQLFTTIELNCRNSTVFGINLLTGFIGMVPIGQVHRLWENLPTVKV